MSSIVGTQPPGFIAPVAAPFVITEITRWAATAYALYQAGQWFAPAVEPAQTIKAEPVVSAEAQAPPAAIIPDPPYVAPGSDSVIAQEPTPPPVSAPPTPLTTTQEQVKAAVPDPLPDPQAPITPAFVTQPLPAPSVGPGVGIAGGVQLNAPWGTEPWTVWAFQFGGERSLVFSGVAWDSAVYQYKAVREDGSSTFSFQPEIVLKRAGVGVSSFQFPRTVRTAPTGPQFDVILLDANDQSWSYSLNKIAAEDPDSRFIQARAYVPKPIPQVEPTPAYVPAPAPNPFQPVPSTPPGTETLPQQFPDTPVIPAPTIPKPAPIPTPITIPETEAPSLTPNVPSSLPAVDEKGKPVVYPPVITTPDDVHVIGNDHVINSGKIQPTLSAIASEVGRIENKLAWMAKPNIGSDIDIGDIFQILGFLSDLFEPDTPETIYRLISVCEKNAQGEPISQSVEEIIPAASPLDAIVARIDALVPLVQGLKDFKQPTCSETPTPSPLLQDPVSINWISDGFSPESGRRVKKLFRYFDESGASLLDTTIHWKDFVWNAGPFMVSCNGTTLGKPQVWAASNAEGRRVIEHAAAITGCDMSKVEWVYGTSRSPRYGMPGVMRVHRNEKGVLGITKRDGPNGLPPAYA
jgi:hypothetical protein